LDKAAKNTVEWSLDLELKGQGITDETVIRPAFPERVLGQVVVAAGLVAVEPGFTGRRGPVRPNRGPWRLAGPSISRQGSARATPARLPVQGPTRAFGLYLAAEQHSVKIRVFSSETRSETEDRSPSSTPSATIDPLSPPKRGLLSKWRDDPPPGYILTGSIRLIDFRPARRLT